MNKKSLLWSLASLMVLVSMILSACGSPATQTPAATEAPAMTEAPVVTEAPATESPVAESPEMCMGAQPGDEISMLYQWSGVEEEALNSVLQPLVDA